MNDNAPGVRKCNASRIRIGNAVRGSLIGDIAADPDDTAIVAAVIAMAYSTRLELVAGGARRAP